VAVGTRASDRGTWIIYSIFDDEINCGAAKNDDCRKVRCSDYLGQCWSSAHTAGTKKGFRSIRMERCGARGLGRNRDIVAIECE
jgi:hypothetical protein